MSKPLILAAEGQTHSEWTIDQKEQRICTDPQYVTAGCIRQACNAAAAAAAIIAPGQVAADDVEQHGFGNVICIVAGGDLLGGLQRAAAVQGLPKNTPSSHVWLGYAGYARSGQALR